MANVLERAIALALFEMTDASMMCTDKECSGHSVEAGIVGPDGGMALGIRDHRMFAVELAATLVHSLEEAADRTKLREWRPPFTLTDELRKRIEQWWATGAKV